MSDYSGDIAIVGMAGLYPDAPDIDAFWENILACHDAVSEAPPDWLAGADILDPDSTELLKIYTQKGGFLGDLARFDPREFGTMPFSVEGAQPDQFLALKVCRDALVDAGYAAGETDHKRTGVILGHSIHVHRANTNGVQQVWFNAQLRSLLRSLLPGAGDAQVREAVDRIQAKLPRISPESVPGLVPNILTGRIANRLDLMGPNYVIDAACSSSLISMDLAMTELREGRADLMLAGGVNTTTSPLVYSVFCSVGALSRQGRIRPFSTEANGTVLGEGVGAVTLKRLEDALRDDDRVYAVIKAVGQSSDGKSNGLMAPRFEGEVLAMRRAYENFGLDPASIGLIEAHGTGIPLGDRTEVSAMREVFGARWSNIPRIPVGSLKSMIGHCIPAAGSAAVIKNALALSRRILPPTLCDEVSPELGFDDTPFYVSTEARPWLHSGDTPRRAAINAFGFGGINAHMVLEASPQGCDPDATAAFLRRAKPTAFAEQVFLCAGHNAEVLLEAATVLEGALEGNLDGEGFAALARNSWRALSPPAPLRLTVVAADPAELHKKLDTATKRIAKTPEAAFQTRNGIYYQPAPLEGKIAFLFPGEMAQYPGLISEGLQAFPEMGDWFDELSDIFDARRPVRLREVAFPPPNGLSEATAANLEELLHQVNYGSELVFAADQALHEQLRDLGITPGAMLGHSTGENAAIVASGRVQLSRPDVAAMIGRMNTIFEEVNASGVVPQGVLLAVAGLPRGTFLKHFEAHAGLHFTMDNCPNQAIVFGPKEAIDALEAELVEETAICTRLPISWGYHTEYVTPMAERFRALFEDVEVTPSEVTLYSCVTGKPFPDDKPGFLETAVSQYVSRVRFTKAIEQLYADGYRMFVECGPNANLTAFVRDILGDAPHLAESADDRRRGLVSQLRHLVARLVSVGVDLPYPERLSPLASADQVRRQELRARQAEAPPLQSALPFVAFEGAELAELQALLGLSGARAASSSASVPVAPSPPQAAPIPAQALPSAPTLPAGAASLGVPIGVMDVSTAFQLPFAFRCTLMQGVPRPAGVTPYLSPLEQTEAANMAQSPRDWAGWALGRLALKQAAGRYLSEQGIALQDNQIAVHDTGNGSILSVPGAVLSLPSAAQATLGQEAIAGVADPAWRIGLGYGRSTGPETVEHVLHQTLQQAAAQTAGADVNGVFLQSITEDSQSAEVVCGGQLISVRYAWLGSGVCALGFARTS